MIDEELIKIARDLAEQRYVEGRHHVFAALRTRAGRLHSGAHIEAKIGRIAVCAEAIAIGAAATAGDTDIAVIVAVTESGDVVPPCGMCRELIRDYSPGALVIVRKHGILQTVPVAELLPVEYRSEDYPNTRKKRESLA
jgi:cytidine deaminase